MNFQNACFERYIRKTDEYALKNTLKYEFELLSTKEIWNELCSTDAN